MDQKYKQVLLNEEYTCSTFATHQSMVVGRKDEIIAFPIKHHNILERESDKLWLFRLMCLSFLKNEQKEPLPFKENKICYWC